MMLSADFSSLWTCKGSCLRFGILLSIPKSPHSITSYSLLILGGTLIFLIHALSANTPDPSQRFWCHCHLPGSCSHQTAPAQGALALPSEAGSGQSTGRGIWQEIICGMRSSPQICCCRWALAPRPQGSLGSCCSFFWRWLWDCNYDFRARFNSCPVIFGKSGPNDKAGFVLRCCLHTINGNFFVILQENLSYPLIQEYWNPGRCSAVFRQLFDPLTDLGCDASWWALSACWTVQQILRRILWQKVHKPQF